MTKKRTPFIGGNWKMNGDLSQLSALAKQIKAKVSDNSSSEVVLFPSFVYLSAIQKIVTGSPVAIGGQNHNRYEQGAHTGEIAVTMLKDVGCTHVLLGHSERRQLYGESDQIIAEKFALAVKHQLTPVLCVGETFTQRKDGAAEATVLAQLEAVLAKIKDIEQFTSTVIAYEPVWAIGTDQTATPEQAQRMHQCLRQHLQQRYGEVAGHIRIIYGGSVKPGNAAAIFAMPDIDGGLIGGAALKAEDFGVIIELAQQID